MLFSINFVDASAKFTLVVMFFGIYKFHCLKCSVGSELENVQNETGYCIGT